MQTIRSGSMIFAISTLAVTFLAPLSEAEDRRTLANQIPKPVANGAVRALGRYSGSARMNVAIGLPLGDKEGLKAILDSLYDPTRPVSGVS